MAKDKCPDCPPPGSPGWMATFSDLMTLLLCFFVLLFSMSTVDAQKVAQMASAMSDMFNISHEASAPSTQISIGNAMGNGLMQLPNAGTGVQQSVSQERIDSAEELQKMASDFKTYFSENLASEHTSEGQQGQDAQEIEVVVNEDEDYLEIKLPNQLLFDSGKADLKPEAFSALHLIAEELRKYPGHDIKTEGHTDNMPINNARFPSNWELSAARAIAVATYFVNQEGISPTNISTEGFGEFRPAYPNDTPENRAKNRRVNVKIMGSASSG